MNVVCAWPPEQVRALDLTNRSDMGHLLRDVEVAEELAIRYRDEMGGRHPHPVLGIQFRTASGARPDDKFFSICVESLERAIGSTHGVTPADVAGARSRLADAGFDLVAAILTFCVFLVLTYLGIQRIRARFDDDELVARTVAGLITSLCLGFVFVGLFAMGSAIERIIYFGNEHVSFRAPEFKRVPQIFSAAVVTFWLLWSLGGALLRTRGASGT
jgi:hypothetical protein